MFYKETNFQDSPIGKISKDWEVGDLDSFCEKVKAGGTPLTTNKNYWNGDIPFVKIEDLTASGKYLVKTQSFISKDGLANSSAWIVPENSLILAMYGSMGEISINKIPAATNQAILGIIPKSKEDVDFLYYWYLFFKRNWKRYAKLTTQANLTAEIVRGSVIPIPPQQERRAVVGVLGVVDSAIGLVDRVIWKTERLKKGLMQKLLTEGIGHKEFKDTEIGKIPKQWVVTKIGEHLELLTGFPFKSNLFSKDKSGIRLVRGINVTSGRLRWDRPQYWNKSTEGLEKYLLAEKDVLIGMDGALVGRNYAIVKKEELPLLLVQRVARLRTKAGIHSEFLYYSIGSNSFRRYVDSVNTSSGIAHISGKQIEDFQIPLPSFEEQLRIVEVLSTVSTKLQLEIKEKSKLERIKQGLMDLLLSGKVRVKVD
jgi:type I restriction enzyme S subunit